VTGRLVEMRVRDLARPEGIAGGESKQTELVPARPIGQGYAWRQAEVQAQSGDISPPADQPKASKAGRGGRSTPMERRPGRLLRGATRTDKT